MRSFFRNGRSGGISARAGAQRPIRVLVAEPDTVSRRLICSLIGVEADMTAECVPSNRLVSSIQENAHDLVVFDAHTLAFGPVGSRMLWGSGHLRFVSWRRRVTTSGADARNIHVLEVGFAGGPEYRGRRSLCWMPEDSRNFRPMARICTCTDCHQLRYWQDPSIATILERYETTTTTGSFLGCGRVKRCKRGNAGHPRRHAGTFIPSA